MTSLLLIILAVLIYQFNLSWFLLLAAVFASAAGWMLTYRKGQ